MTQNIYDDEEFFAGYSQLPRSRKGLDGMPEWPAMRAMLPPLRGLKVVDLGCGFGWFCRWARAQGAAQVSGIDVSAKMLARARAETQDPAITYTQADLERLQLPRGSFGLVYSALALHYLESLEAVLAEAWRALAPGGSFVASVEHPIYTAPAHGDWTVDRDGRRSWPVNGYLVEGPRSRDWLAPGVIKQHRTIGTWFRLLRQVGFEVRQIVEWGPSDAQIAAQPELAEERERPMFLLLAAGRGSAP